MAENKWCDKCEKEMMAQMSGQKEFAVLCNDFKCILFTIRLTQTLLKDEGDSDEDEDEEEEEEERPRKRSVPRQEDAHAAAKKRI